MKKLDSFWFHALDGCFGIVVGEDDRTGKRKAYGAVVGGFNEEADEQHIMVHGGPVSAAYLREIADKLDPPAPGTTRADIFKELEARFPDQVMHMRSTMKDRAEWLAWTGQEPE